MSETWKPVEGWPYEVSDLGRVRSLGGRPGAIAGRILRPQVSRSRSGTPYESVTLRDYPRSWMVKVHTLVLTVFVGPRPTSQHQANHLNGQKRDNRLANLEWVTCQENIRHAFATGLKRPSKSGAKIPVNDIPGLRSRYADGESTRALADEYGVDVTTMQDLVARRTWRDIA